MSKSNLAKTLRRPLLLASVALLFQTGAALAADATADAQAQARELLGGQTPSRTFVPATRAHEAFSPPGVEPQEQARRLILGASSFGNTASATLVVQEHGRSSNDAQAMAQRMILGHAG